MDTLCKLLTVLVITFIIYPESSDTSCEFIHKENKTVQVCQEQSLTSDEISIDSDGAPGGNSITCWCTMERPQNLTINVTMDPRIIRNGNGIQFQISNAGHDTVYYAEQDRNKKNIVLQESANITFSKTSARHNSSICLSLKAAGSSANFTVRCHQYHLVAEDTTERESADSVNPYDTRTVVVTSARRPKGKGDTSIIRAAKNCKYETEQSSTVTELTTTGFTTPLPQDQENTNTDSLQTETEQSSTVTELTTTGFTKPLPQDLENTNTDSLQTVLIPVIAASAAAVLLTTIFATIIICRKCRRKNNQTSETMKMETTANRTHVRKNLDYDYAEDCPFNNLSHPAKQQRTLQTIEPEDHATNSYADIVEFGQQSSCAEPRNDTYSASSPSKGAKRSETETVYNTVGVVDNAYVATENIYNTAGVCAEGVYNTLNETLKAKIANENVYGASAGPVF